METAKQFKLDYLDDRIERALIEREQLFSEFNKRDRLKENKEWSRYKSYIGVNTRKITMLRNKWALVKELN